MFCRVLSTNLQRSFAIKIWQTKFIPPYSFKRNLFLKTYDKVLPERTPIKTKHKEILIEKFDEDIYHPQNDPDSFGPAISNQYDEDDPGDQAEDDYLKYPPTKFQKLEIKDYAILIKNHLNQNHIKEAINILEIRMKDDRVQPDRYIYNLLISGCAKAGYSRKAFQLFNKMKQSGYTPSGGTYTSLFNACSNSPRSDDGLGKANKLRELMMKKAYDPNDINYNAMIKAFGRCGDLQTAFLLADEMIEKRLAISSTTFNFLLQACASDKEFGFRHALLTWHKMRSRRISPDIYSYNLMLRCVRDCSIGDLNTIEEVITRILSKDKIKVEQIEIKKVLLINKPNDSNQLIESSEKLNNDDEKNLQINSVEDEQTFLDETPNLLSSNPHLGNLMKISEIQNPQDRLLLLGGLSGFLAEMHKSKITPGIKTFTTLLEVIPPTKVAEKKLISMIRKIGLKCDIDFFNILIKKRSLRFDYDGAKEVLNMIKTAKLHPDIVTYGVLALGCQTKDEARELLFQMEKKEIRMNIQILGAMLRQGCANKNFLYIDEIMQITLEENIKPNEEFLRHLDYFNKQCYKLEDSRHPLAKRYNFKKNFENFKNKLNIWYEENNIGGLKLEDAITKIKERPYNQFKEVQKDGFENLKNTELLKKIKIRKYIKKIKLKDLKDDDDEKLDSDGGSNKSNIKSYKAIE